MSSSRGMTCSRTNRWSCLRMRVKSSGSMGSSRTTDERRRLLGSTLYQISKICQAYGRVGRARTAGMDPLSVLVGPETQRVEHLDRLLTSGTQVQGDGVRGAARVPGAQCLEDGLVLADRALPPVLRELIETGRHVLGQLCQDRRQSPRAARLVDDLVESEVQLLLRSRVLACLHGCDEGGQFVQLVTG